MRCWFLGSLLATHGNISWESCLSLPAHQRIRRQLVGLIILFPYAENISQERLYTTNIKYLAYEIPCWNFQEPSVVLSGRV